MKRRRRRHAIIKEDNCFYKKLFLQEQKYIPLKMSLNYIPRVTELDAVQLNNQVEDLLKHQLLQATNFIEPGKLQTFLPELELLIRTWMFKYSLVNNRYTFGQQMLSLKYKDDNFSKSKLYWYYGYTIGIKYLKDRALYSLTTNTNIQNFVHKVERFQLIADVLNFLRFIQCGKYPVLIDFILGLELSADKLTREDLTDLAWTRELLWHNLIELLGTSISLMNMFGLRRKLTNVLKYMWWRNHSRSSVSTKPIKMTIHTVCAGCSSNPVLPYTMGCSHVFCYYCLMANKTADEDYACPQCYYNGKDINKFVQN